MIRHTNCQYPNCPNNGVVGDPWCSEHKDNSLRRKGRERSSYDKWYGLKQWRSIRNLILKRNPLCVNCFSTGKLTPATVVDHIEPHRGNYELFIDTKNLQSLCVNCHNEKTGSGK